MKTIKLLAIFIFLCQTLQAQTYTEATLPDTMIVVSIKDEMTDKISYSASKNIICTEDDGKKGFSLSAFIEQDLSINDLKVKMVGIGSCVEKNTIIILFEDDSKLNLTCWNEFNCKGNAWFKIKKADIDLLSSKKIKKVRVQNGRSFESFTSEIEPKDQDFFIHLFRMLNHKQVFEYKSK